MKRLTGPRRPQLSFGTLIVVGIILVALLAAITAPESGDLWGPVVNWADNVVQTYKEYWPSLSQSWEEKLRNSKEGVRTPPPPLESTATPIP